MDHDVRNAASRDRMREAGLGLSEHDLVATVDAGWTVAATFAHVAFWDRFVHARWVAVLAGADIGPAVAAPGIIDWTNAAALPQWMSLPPRVCVEQAIKAAEELDALIEQAPAWAVDRVVALGRMGWLDRAPHREQHLDQVAAALAARP